jgi:hypothetical protein
MNRAKGKPIYITFRSGSKQFTGLIASWQSDERGLLCGTLNLTRCYSAEGLISWPIEVHHSRITSVIFIKP